VKITMQSTNELITVNGALARIWVGQTENGIPVTCYVTNVMVARTEDLSEFERELREVRPPVIAQARADSIAANDPPAAAGEAVAP
jgi:hypothetical protein